MKNLLNPTPAQVKYRNRLWAQALVENKRKATGTMKDKSGGRCCLRVAEDVALSLFPEHIRDEYIARERRDSQPGATVRKFFGWASTMPHLVTPGNNSECAMTLNDDRNWKGKQKGIPHKLIAECVLNTFVHPSTPKWSFQLD